MRTQLEEFLGRPISDDMWSLLVSDDYIPGFHRGEITIGRLAQRVEEVENASGRRPRSSKADRLQFAEPGELARRAATRAEALAELMAAEARRDDRVQTFRRKVLRNHLVKPEKVGPWLERRSRQGERVRHKVLGQPSKSAPETIDGLPVIEYVTPTVEFATPESRGVQRVMSSDKLEWLRQLSEQLASKFGWQRAQATAFILSDVVPIVPTIRVRTVLKAPIKAASRIHLEVDPTATPDEVRERYAAVRKSLLTARSRRMSPKHLQLAVFAYERQDADGKWEGWDSHCQEWNRMHTDPSWRYEDWRQFRRDAANAIERLLDPPFPLL